jgi:two-component system, OmpR family, copper resistance phosphate regulon response regulator CusR
MKPAQSGSAIGRILVVEDEDKVRRSLQQGLRSEGYDVVTAATGEDGFQQALHGQYACIVLDLLLPKKSGLQTLADLRKAGKRVPVLILTARDTIQDRVIGLDAGADDYLVKPFAFDELLARLRALLRRGQPDRETVLRAADVEMDLVTRQVRRRGQVIELTARGFELLEYLLRHKNTIVTRDMLSRDVWKEPSAGLTNVIEVYVMLLRRAIEVHGQPPLIHTIRGLGYRLQD